MERVLVDNASLLTVTFYQDGAAADLDDPPSVTIVDEAGASVTSGTATKPASTTGVYTFTLPAQSQLKRLTVTWDGAYGGNDAQLQTGVEIVGGFLFTLAELAAQDGCSGMTAAQRIDARTIVENAFEEYCGFAFVPRYERESHYRCGTIILKRLEARQLISVTDDDVAQTITGWTIDTLGQIRAGNFGNLSLVTGVTTIEYTHGLDRPPSDLKRAALRYARHVLLSENSTVPDRANLMTTEWGSFRLQTADETRDRPTGLPEIDAVLNRYRRAGIA